jgi:hypothetical protein
MRWEEKAPRIIKLYTTQEVTCDTGVCIRTSSTCFSKARDTILSHTLTILSDCLVNVFSDGTAKLQSAVSRKISS